MINDRSLFAPAPRRKRGMILTLVGSLLFHGSLVGVAAFWPTRPAGEKINITQVEMEPGLPPGPQLPEAPAPADTEPEAPVLKAVEPVADQPLAVEPSADDMTLATPTPRPAVRVASPHSNPAPSLTRAARAPGSLSTGGSAGGAPGNVPGAGRPGVRWSVPKPIYPAALRLAHMQGSGSVRVTTDGAGRVVTAVAVQSTGSRMLDDLTCQTAKMQWSGPPNSMTTVPITYTLR